MSYFPEAKPAAAGPPAPTSAVFWAEEKLSFFALGAGRLSVSDDEAKAERALPRPGDRRSFSHLVDVHVKHEDYVSGFLTSGRRAGSCVLVRKEQGRQLVNTGDVPGVST